MIGVVVSILIAKHAFGGLGQNFSITLVGRDILMISFLLLTTWYQPYYKSQVMTAASPYLCYRNRLVVLSNYTIEMFVGKIPGSIGEVSRALIMGSLLLVEIELKL